MPAFTQSLEEQFKSLGFNNYHEMIAARQSMEQISYLSTSEKIELPNGNGTENMVFRFVTYRDERFNSEYILAIFAAIEKKVKQDDILVPVLFNEKKFGSGTGGLITKNEMTMQVLLEEGMTMTQLDKIRNVLEKHNTVKLSSGIRSSL